jgi:predicted transcriptional regulator
MSENQNLFGWPMPEPRDAGRPEHVPTDENRNKIMMMLVFGKTNAEIAKALGLSQPTLRKHYLQQLSQRKVARLQLDMQLWAALYEKAVAGDVGANKELAKRVDRHDIAELASSFGADTSRRRETAPKQEKLGKKEQALRDAEAAAAESGDWGDDLIPGVVN